MAQYVRQANEENAGSCPPDPVLVIQAMGRKIGFIPAAARLADPRREMPLQIYMAEAGLNLEQLGENVIKQLETDRRCVVVVSEGFDVGDVGAVKDSFGHTMFSASQMTVAQIVVNHLNSLKLPVPGKARGQVPGTDWRNAIAYASPVDLDEAYNVGLHAVSLARTEGNGFMATILRDRSQSSYSVRFDKVPLEQVAAKDRTFPKDWIAPNRHRRDRRLPRLRPPFDRRRLGERPPRGWPGSFCENHEGSGAPEAARVRAADLPEVGVS